MIFGYARVSTTDQDPHLQIDALRLAGVPEEHIYVDHASGMKASRPQFDVLMKVLRKDDTLVVWKLDRIGRSHSHLIAVVTELGERGVGFRCLTGVPIDTTTPEGLLMFRIFAALAEFERDLIRERVNAGLAAARARGRTGGRKPRLTEDQAELAQQLYDARQHTVQQIADMFGVPRGTVYGYLNRQAVENAEAGEVDGFLAERLEHLTEDAVAG